MKYNPHFNLLRQLASIDSETDSAESRLIKHLGVSEHISDRDIVIALRVTENKQTYPSLSDLPIKNKIDLMIDFAEVIKQDKLEQDADWNVLASFSEKLGYDKKTLVELVAASRSEAMSNLKRTLLNSHTNE